MPGVYEYVCTCNLLPFISLCKEGSINDTPIKLVLDTCSSDVHRLVSRIPCRNPQYYLQVIVIVS